MNACLDDRTLDDFVHARLPDDARAAAEAHVDSCPECSAIVSVLAGGSVLTHAAEQSADPDLLAKGTAIGRHVIVELRGEGAMGVVYLAYDPELDRRVALKLLRAGSAPGASDRMQREAQAMAKVAHPNVVTVHDVGRFRGAVFLAMEFVEGPTLRAWSSGDRSPAARVDVLIAAGRGLAAAHAAGLVHRDFKPENVIVGNDGRVRVTDFGLSRVEARDASVAATLDLEAPPLVTLTRTGAILGTPAYMAPELWRSEDATVASDQFAFAVTACEVLFGQRPFQGARAAELRAAIERGPSLPNSSPELARVRPILTRALSPRAADRFPSMDALLSAMDPPRVARARKSRAWIAIPAVLAAGATITIAIASTRQNKADPCGAGAALAAGVMDENDASLLRAAFTRVGSASGEATWASGAADRAVAAIRAYSTQWTSAYRETCEATAVRHEQSPALLDARMHCLNRSLAEASALADRFEHADADTVLRAAEATDSLTPIASCADTTSLSAMESAPTGDKGAALAAIETRLARAQASSAGGATSDAQIAEARAIAKDATAIGYRPTIAASELLLATFLRRNGAFSEASREANDALVAAEGSHDDRDAALVWLELLALHGEEGSFAAAIAAEAPATAAIARIASPEDLEATLRFELGVARTNVADYDGAKRDLDATLAAREKLYGPQHLDVSRTLTALGNLSRVRGDLDDALAMHHRALDMDTAILGADHPALARHHHNIGGVLRLQGKLDEAEAEYERALDLETRGAGPRSLAVGRTENSLGLVAIAKRDWPTARTHLDRALDILGTHPDSALPLANLGIVEAAENKPDRAIARFDQALAIYSAEGREDATVADVRASRAKSEAALRGRKNNRVPPPTTTTSLTPAPPPPMPTASGPLQPTRPAQSAQPAQGSYGAAQTFDNERR